jgi:hypothetical protein
MKMQNASLEAFFMQFGLQSITLLAYDFCETNLVSVPSIRCELLSGRTLIRRNRYSSLKIKFSYSERLSLQATRTFVSY